MTNFPTALRPSLGGSSFICRGIDGSHVAIDSAAIHAYEKKPPKRKSEQSGNANWGAKFDSFGNKITWFGYKLHLAVDTKSELPLALEVMPAHVNDGEMTAIT